MTEQEFASTQPLKPIPEQETDERLAPAREQHAPLAVPSSLWGAFTLIARFEMAVALSIPVVVGAVMGWWQIGSFSTVTFLFTFVSVFAAALGINLLHEYHDFLRSREQETRAVDEPFVTGYGMMAAGAIEPLVVRGMAHILLALAFVCNLWLTLLAGWPVLCFAGFAFLLAYFYAVPPIHYGYRGWGLGSIGVFLCCGLLQTTGSYYVQSGTLGWLPIWASVPLGLLVMVTFLHYNIIHYRRDWALRNRTLAVTLGLERALDLSALFTVLAYVTILMMVALTPAPLWALISLGAMPIALGPFANVRRDQLSPNDCFNLYGAVVSATILTGLLLGLGFWADKIF